MTLLHDFGNLMRETFALVPLPLVRGLFLLLLLGLLVWVLRLPRQQTTPPEGTGHWSEDLRLWAALALLWQIIIYSVL